MTDHIADKAGFLAALPPDDPERRRGEAHARSCPSCREALDEGTRLMGLLREALPLAAPTVAELSRAGREIEAETAGERQATRRLALVSAAAVSVAWVFQLMVGSGFVLNTHHAVVSLSVLALAIASVTVMRGRERWVVPVLVATSGVLAYVAGSSAGFDPGIGIRCAFRELWAAGITWAIVLTVAWRQGIPLSRWNVTAIATAGALAAHAGQHIACEVPHAEGHLIAFHFSAVVLATALGAIVARVRPAAVPQG
jgi:hypothetical protein